MQVRLNPKTWIVAGLCLAPLCLLPVSLTTRLILLLVLSATLLFSGFGMRYFSYVILGVGPVALMALIIQTISYTSPQTIYGQWSLGNLLTFTVSAEGIIYGAHFALQILNFATAIAFISIPNSPGKIRWALTDWKLPSRIIYLLVTSLNAPTLLGRYVGIVRESQQRRGIDDSTTSKRFIAGIKSMGALINLILLEHEDRAVSIGQRSVDAGQERTSYTSYADTRLQAISRWGMVLGALVLMLGSLLS